MTSLTRRGVAFVAGGFLSLALGLAFASLAAGAVGIALLLCVVEAATRASAPNVRVERSVSADVVREGVPVRVALRIFAPKGLQLNVEDVPGAGLAIVEGSPQKEGEGPLEMDYTIEGRSPGRWHIGPLSLRFRDPLGLVEHGLLADGVDQVTVYPRPDEVRDSPVASRLAMLLGGPHATGQAGAGSDFFALRAFQEGDTMRDVNWRASARAGNGLVVNQREKESQALVTFFLDNRAASAIGTLARNPRAETIRAFATLATLSQRRRDQPRLILYGEGTSTPTLARPGDSSLASLLDPVLDTPPSGRTGLADAVRSTLPALRARAPAVVVTSLLGDDSASDALATLRAMEQYVLVIAIRPTPFLRLASVPDERIAAVEARHAALLEDLRGRGARVVDWDVERPLPLSLAEEAMR